MTRAITMWDFSWLLRRFGSEAEYADVGRVLAELAERRYDVVRIDAFPQWIAADSTGAITQEIHSVPQHETFMWGNHVPVTVRPRQALVEFLHGLRERGLTAALSTWLTEDATGRSAAIRTPQDLARVWIETLDFITAAGLLDVIEYVDLCNEWPLFVPSLHAEIWPTETDRGHGSGAVGWTDDDVQRVDTYNLALRAVKAAYPDLPVLFSYCLRGSRLPAADDCMRIDTSDFDLAEVHLWLSSDEKFGTATEFPVDYNGWASLAAHQRGIEARYAGERNVWFRQLEELLDRWKAWADGRGLPIWTTECWASVFWQPDLIESPHWGTDWAYVKDVAEFAVPLAVARGWTGVATSNFSQPHHAGMWADIGWHQRMNDLIHAG